MFTFVPVLERWLVEWLWNDRLRAWTERMWTDHIVMDPSHWLGVSLLMCSHDGTVATPADNATMLTTAAAAAATTVAAKKEAAEALPLLPCAPWNGDGSVGGGSSTAVLRFSSRQRTSPRWGGVTYGNASGIYGSGAGQSDGSSPPPDDASLLRIDRSEWIAGAFLGMVLFYCCLVAYRIYQTRHRRSDLDPVASAPGNAPHQSVSAAARVVGDAGDNNPQSTGIRTSDATGATGPTATSAVTRTRHDEDERLGVPAQSSSPPEANPVLGRVDVELISSPDGHRVHSAIFHGPLRRDDQRPSPVSSSSLSSSHPSLSSSPSSPTRLASVVTPQSPSVAAVRSIPVSPLRPLNLGESAELSTPSPDRVALAFAPPPLATTAIMERNVAGSSPLPQDASLSAAASPFPFAEPSLGVVYKVHNDAEFDQLAAWCVAQRRILVIDYTAAWCGPCRRIAPEFEALCLKSHANTPEADETRNLFVFAKVDVDVCPLTAGRNNVQAMPTFQVWFDGAKRRDLTGANVAALRQMLLQSHRDYATGQWNGGSVRSNSGGGGGGSSTSAAAAVVVDVPTLTVRGGSVGRV